ncbi:MAG: hypothetical protein CMJ58_20180 [Planctomycetaceae bacterium]|nr:hypothetical protein [Planctomycetaceae bacterium]
MAVADHDHRREAEAPTALDHGGATLDLHDVFGQFAALALRRSAAAAALAIAALTISATSTIRRTAALTF